MATVTPDSEETCRLLEQIDAGEEGAIGALLERHRGWMRRLVGHRQDGRLRSRLDASDVVQETQLETFRRLQDFLARRPMPFRLWLRKTLQERLRMFERKHVEASRRSVAREATAPNLSSGMMIGEVAASDPTPSQLVNQDDLSRRVHEAIGRLEETDREILLIRTFEGLSYAEAGYVLEIAPAAARKRHGRALLRLQKLLKQAGVTESQV